MIYNISDATIREIKQGFFHNNMSGIYSCLLCGAQFEEGIIYPVDNLLTDARRAAALHVDKQHGPVFNLLLAEDKKRTGLTDTQRDLLARFYSGASDKEIAGATGTSPSTVRYQRFNFREKAKQAKITLALAELLEEKLKRGGGELPKIHPTATMVDERYMTTEGEAEKIIKTFFLSLSPPVLKGFSSKEKNKLVILKIIADQFEPSIRYTEKQVNGILKPIYGDYVTLRRYLIEYGFMDRTIDCSQYWLK